MERPVCPVTIDAAFGRKLVAWLGGDPARIKNNWCWTKFVQTYPEYKQQVRDYFVDAAARGEGGARKLLDRHPSFWGV